MATPGCARVIVPHEACAHSRRQLEPHANLPDRIRRHLHPAPVEIEDASVELLVEVVEDGLGSHPGQLLQAALHVQQHDVLADKTSIVCWRWSGLTSFFFFRPLPKESARESQALGVLLLAGIDALARGELARGELECCGVPLDEVLLDAIAFWPPATGAAATAGSELLRPLRFFFEGAVLPLG